MKTQNKSSGSELKRLAGRFTEVFEGEPWYGTSLRGILASVNPGWAFESPGPGTHSIAELTAHMIGWRVVAICRLQGDTEYLPDQEETFNWRRISPKRSRAWNKLNERLISSQDELLALLGLFEEADLDHTVPGMSYSRRTLLEGIIDHDLYHIGQIALIQKLLQSRYQPKTAPLRYSYRIFPYRFLSRNK